MNVPDYYAMLEVSPAASLDEIKQAYRRLARLYHPDLNKQVQDSRIKQINEAYAVLSDMVRRTNYDIQRLEQLKQEILLKTLLQQRELNHRDQKKMTWVQGAAGFVRELKKEMHD